MTYPIPKLPIFAQNQMGTQTVNAPALGARVRVLPGYYLMQVRGADVQVYNGPDNGSLVASTQCVTIANGRPAIEIRVDGETYFHLFSAAGAGYVDFIRMT